MNTYRVTIYGRISEKKRRINIKAWNIGEVYDCVHGGRRINGAEEIIKIERWHNKD